MRLDEICYMLAETFMKQREIHTKQTLFFPTPKLPNKKPAKDNIIGNVCVGMIVLGFIRLNI